MRLQYRLNVTNQEAIDAFKYGRVGVEKIDVYPVWVLSDDEVYQNEWFN